MRKGLTIGGAVAAIVLGTGGTALSYTHARGAPDPQTATDAQVIDYYESGAYAHDAGRVVGKARRTLERQVEARRHGDPPPAIVLDIDDTALSNYACEKAQGGFGSTELVGCIVNAGVETTTGTGRGLPRIEPVYRLYAKAKRMGLAIFFITGRPVSTRAVTRQNLKARGYGSYERLTTNSGLLPASGSLVPYKSGERARIEREGYDIVLNMGDQVSDLKGGHANSKFLLPNPMYFTP